MTIQVYSFQINPLIIHPSPRDIEVVQKSLEDVYFIDRLIIKYHRPEYLAYEFAQQYFLEHKEYTHLIIWPDDLVASVKDVTQLCLDLIEKPYQVIGGICQIDNDWYADRMIISLKPLHPKRGDRFRHFEYFRDYYQQNYEEGGYGELLPLYQDKPIIRTYWQGFPLMAIKRNVLQEITFRNDSEFNNISKEEGCCLDDVFCYDCSMEDIPMHTDLRIRMNHLKINVNNAVMLPKGNKPYTKMLKSKNKIEVFQVNERFVGGPVDFS